MGLTAGLGKVTEKSSVFSGKAYGVQRRNRATDALAVLATHTHGQGPPPNVQGRVQRAASAISADKTSRLDGKVEYKVIICSAFKWVPVLMKRSQLLQIIGDIIQLNCLSEHVIIQ